ncbi:TIGR03943 family putative permease subunit [Nonomuraea sp. NPDC059194]|uniref:TIGR03943 family putative permease subunit n=1 Tax=Nonomuraea sp. NPDC059194 TaxID=3346764 RepID=UPI0036C5D2A2
MSQNLVLMLLGGALLRISAFSTTYVNYVKPGFRPFLVAAGLVIFVIGLLGLVHRAKEHHHHGPKVAWLLCLPVFAVFLIAPPALGSFAAARSDAPPPPRSQALDAYAPLRGDRPVEMPMSEFIGRVFSDSSQTLKDKPVKLTGFVTPAKKKGQWYVTRMQLACCAADAYALKVIVRDAPPPEADTWVQVTGTWVPKEIDPNATGVIYAELAATDVEPVQAPAEPYE